MMGRYYEDDDYLTPASMMSYMPQAIQLYLSMGFLTQQKIDEMLSREWSNAINDSDSTMILGAYSVYEIFQSINGDVTLKRIDNKQEDMFGGDWLDITDMPGENIWAYQETIPLVAALLMGYYYGDGDIGKLGTVLSSIAGIQAIGCDAGDSETKEMIVREYMGFFRIINKKINDFGIHITASTDVSYGTKFDPNNNQVLFGKYEGRGIGDEFNTVLAIPIVDIPQILGALCKFSGRSGDGGRVLIQWYVRNFGNK